MTRDILRGLKLQSNWHAPCHLLAVLALYVASAVLAWQVQLWWFWLLVWALQGFVLVGLTSMVHECIHNLFTRNKTINRIMGSIVSALILKNFTFHRCFHIRHHARTTVSGDPEQAEDLTTVGAYMKRFLMYASFFGAFFTAQNVVRAWFGRFPEYISSQKFRRAVLVDSGVQVIFLLGVVAAAIYFPEIVIYCYLVPLFAFVVIGFFVMLPEHQNTTRGSDPFANTRTIESNFIFRFLFWNNNYHAEHHAYPNVPYYSLGALHRLIHCQIVHKASTYVGYHAQLLYALTVHKQSQQRIGDSTQ